MSDQTLIEKVLARDVLNIQKRVAAGEAITAAERAVLEREAGKVADTGRPEYALRKADLARALEISKQRLNGHCKKPGFPEPTPQGYHVETCRGWLLENGMVDRSDDDFEEARRRKTVAEANIAEMKQRQMENQLLDAGAVERTWNNAMSVVKQIVLAQTHLSMDARAEIFDALQLGREQYAMRGRELEESAEEVVTGELKRNL